MPDDDDDDKKKKPVDELAGDKLIKAGKKPKVAAATKSTAKTKRPTVTKPKGSASAKKK